MVYLSTFCFNYSYAKMIKQHSCFHTSLLFLMTTRGHEMSTSEQICQCLDTSSHRSHIISWTVAWFSAQISMSALAHPLTHRPACPNFELTNYLPDRAGKGFTLKNKDISIFCSSVLLVLSDPILNLILKWF